MKTMVEKFDIMQDTLKSQQDKIDDLHKKTKNIGADYHYPTSIETPSHPKYKGKTIDPQEWGNVGIAPEKTNPEPQQVHFAELKRSSQIQDPVNPKDDKITRL